jgi:hypothetical protein
MRNVINVRKGGSDQGVLLALDWSVFVDYDRDFLILELLELLLWNLFLWFLSFGFGFGFVLFFLIGKFLLFLDSLLLFFLFGIESFL